MNIYSLYKLYDVSWSRLCAVQCWTNFQLAVITSSRRYLYIYKNVQCCLAYKTKKTSSSPSICQLQICDDYFRIVINEKRKCTTGNEFCWEGRSVKVSGYNILKTLVNFTFLIPVWWILGSTCPDYLSVMVFKIHKHLSRSWFSNLTLFRTLTWRVITHDRRTWERRLFERFGIFDC